MKYTPLHPDEIRQKVYEEAKKQFLTRGIKATEMKKLAETVGIGRTTLYRYYPSLDHLAFMVATEFWDAIFEGNQEDSIDQEKTGYENLVEFFDRMIKGSFEKTGELLFFSEFDALFVLGKYPDFPAALEYLDHVKKVSELQARLVEKGQADGSLRQDINVYERLFGISFSIFGYEQRTALYAPELREPGKELIYWIAHTLLEDLRKKG